ncbi:uncharacterized protein LOC143037486 [Oratosquilla oratoria]|uniref:uncharacterized protein LOC143037486 n=1 Tax=Oratosquilla oratoria TaxID=337810 RepID=UPI003F762DBC
MLADQSVFGAVVCVESYRRLLPSILFDSRSSVGLTFLQLATMRSWVLCLGLLVCMVAGQPLGQDAEAAAPPAALPDTTETRLFRSLKPSGQRGVIHRALMLDRDSSFHHQVRAQENQQLDSNFQRDPTAGRLVKRMNSYVREKWDLTPEQMDQLAETGRLCNDRGECIDVNYDIGVNCCPFG